MQSGVENPPELESPRPISRVWEGWSTLGFGIAVFGVYAVVQSIVAGVFAVRLFLANPGLDPFESLPQFESDGLLISIATIASAVIGVGFIVLFIVIRKRASIAEYLALRPLSKMTWLALLGVTVVLLAISFGLDQVIKSSQNNDFMVRAYQSSIWPALLWVATVIFAPLFEEGFFRGFLFIGWQQSRIGAVGAIALTSLTWAALHALQYDVYGVVTVLVLGIVMGVVRLVTGSLWSTLFLHALWNLIAMVQTVIYLQT